MKAEQLCRFRTDEAGYTICAKSDGITAENAEHFSNVFNANMNQLFIVDGRYEFGREVLTYIRNDDDFFIAKSTMRTDIEGRPTIFHHAYLFKYEDYKTSMMTDPALMLSIPVAQMYTSEVNIGSVAPFEPDFSKANAFNIDELRKKYNLTREKYAKLLIGAYRAVLSGRSLKIVTRLECDATETIREIAYCIAVGMPPALRGKITVSDAVNAQVAICISVPSGGNAYGTPAYIFDLDRGELSPKESASGGVYEIFDMIAGYTVDERSKYFAEIVNEIASFVQIDAATFEVFAAMNYLMYDKIEGNELRLLNWLIISDQKLGGALNYAEYYDVISYLLNRLNDKAVNLETFTGMLIQRYLEGCRDETDVKHKLVFDESILNSIGFLSAEMSRKLLKDLLEKTFENYPSELIRRLMDNIPGDSEFMYSETMLNMVKIVLHRNIEELVDKANVIIDSCSDEICEKLTKQILTETQNQQLNAAENAVLQHLIERLIKLEYRMGEEYYDMLDAHCAEYDDALMNTCVQYLINVRISGEGDLNEQLDDLIEVRDTYPDYFRVVETVLTNEEYRDNDLWEKYRSATCFDSQTLYEYDEICSICAQYNMFKNPMGAFELRVKQIWIEKYKNDLNNVAADADANAYAVVINKSLKYLNTISISAAAKAELRGATINLFMENIEYRNFFHIIDIKDGGWTNYASSDDAKRKRALYKHCLAVSANPRQAEGLCVFFIKQKFNEEELKQLQAFLIEFAESIYKKNNGYISWDLLLLSSFKKEKKGYYYDYTDLLKRLSQNELFAQSHKACTGTSYLLSDSEPLRKCIYRTAVSYKNACPLFAALADELKPGRGALASFFGHLGKSSKQSEADEPDAQSSKKRNSDKSKKKK